MAVSFCNHSLLTPPRPSSSFSVKPSKIRQPKPLLPLRSLHHRPRLSNPIIGFPLSNSSPLSNYYSQSRSFKAYLAAEDSALTENRRNDVKASEEKADGEQASSLKNLIRIYKAAILHGDERIVLDIESRIKDIENEHTQLMQKASALSAEITSGKEKTIRLQADFDNFRKRSEKEKLNIRSDAQGEVIESLLPLVDSFERAKQQLKPETEKEKKIDTSYQGIYKQFVEIMRSLQVVAVATVGKPFDPALHEAIAREESQMYEEGVVIQEFRRGFLLSNRLLRPAMVKVSSGPGKKKAPLSSEQPATAAKVDGR